jgi:transcriptional regulator with XRE-family HTH domain
MMVNTKHGVNGNQTHSQSVGRRNSPPSQALGREPGLHRNVIGRLERGTYNPTVMTLLSIVAEFDISLSELVSSAERRMR